MGNFIEPFGLHFSMFHKTIETQTTDAQKKKWLPLVRGVKIVGTYAQTEMGHGTHLRGLETTATYDPATLSAARSAAKGDRGLSD